MMSRLSNRLEVQGLYHDRNDTYGQSLVLFILIKNFLKR